jgi:uncharacterized cupredoxin-like copper-binding protein
MTLRIAPALAAALAATPVAAAGGGLEIEGSEFAFEPARVEVEAGETTRITFENTGAVSHNLTIPALDAATETIQAGGSATLTVSPEETGSHEIRCTVPGHADAGMTGELVVTGEAPQ